MLSWFSGKGAEAMRNHGVDRELAFHVEELTAANVEAGMEPVEARRQALLSFGGEEQVRQQVREVHSSALREALRFHLRAALRFLRQAPSFACAVVGTLALAIGANSAVFSALEAIVLHGCPFPIASSWYACTSTTASWGSMSPLWPQRV